MKPFPPLVFFGSDSFSAAVLQRLIEDETFTHSLKYVVTKTPRISGRGLRKNPTPVELLVESRENVTVLHADSSRELDETLKSHGVDSLGAMGVLVSYGVIVSADTLAMFKPCIINFHPSALPRYRGPSPIETAMLDGERTIGLSIMQLVKKMDAGPVYATGSIDIDEQMSKDQVYESVVSAGTPLLLDTLSKIADGSIQPVAQDEATATFTRIITKQDGQMDLASKTAQQLAREVRVYLGFPKSRTELFGHQVIVTKAHASDSPAPKSVALACKDDTTLVIDEVVAPSGRTMSAEAFARGYAA